MKLMWNVKSNWYKYQLVCLKIKTCLTYKNTNNGKSMNMWIGHQKIIMDLLSIKESKKLH